MQILEQLKHCDEFRDFDHFTTLISEDIVVQLKKSRLVDVILDISKSIHDPNIHTFYFHYKMTSPLIMKYSFLSGHNY